MSESTLGQIKSFVIRTSRMSPAQKRGWERYGEQFIVPFAGDVDRITRNVFPGSRSAPSVETGYRFRHGTGAGDPGGK